MRLGSPRRRLLAWGLALPVLVVSAWTVWHTVDRTVLAAAWRAIGDAPVAIAAAMGVYALAFMLRAWAWRRVLPGLTFGHALAGIHLALAGNHLLPLRLGEPLRVSSVVRRTDMTLAGATASTLTLRAADVLGLGVLAAVLGPRLAQGLVGNWWWALVAPALVVVVAGGLWLRRQITVDGLRARLPGAGVAAATTLAWVAEAAVLWQVARLAGLDVAPVDALLISVVAVAGQVAAVAPSGFGTYEAAGTAAFAALGFDPTVGLAVVLTAHALKALYSLLGGLVATLAPAPGLFGRVRLPRRRPAHPDERVATDPLIATSVATMRPTLQPHRWRPRSVPTPHHFAASVATMRPTMRACAQPPTWSGAHAAPADGATAPAGTVPVVLFLPAHDEEASVASVVGRAPATVRGHPVEVVVVDDGSQDATAAAARRAGARVVALDGHTGLGAAVRAGLADATARRAAAVAFCDADGEYAPEELERVMGPVLDGTADYVVGSRFAGRIDKMHWHRRVGNRALTRWVAFVARTPISDGQSGYRALSPAAAAAAEVTHDYNYAQVLTLDLLAKGFRYAEVPISYRWRQQGRSFVKLGTYLRHVVPSVWRLVNRQPPPATVTR